MAAADTVEYADLAGCQAAVRTVGEAALRPPAVQHPALEGDGRGLLGGVPGPDPVGHRDALPVGEEAHLDDGVRAVLLAVSVPPHAPDEDLPVGVGDEVPVLLGLAVEVRAVVEDVPLRESELLPGVLPEALLYVVGVLRQHGEEEDHVVLRPGLHAHIVSGEPEGPQLRAGVHDPHGGSGEGEATDGEPPLPLIPVQDPVHPEPSPDFLYIEPSYVPGDGHGGPSPFRRKLRREVHLLGGGELLLVLLGGHLLRHLLRVGVGILVSLGAQLGFASEGEDDLRGDLLPFPYAVGYVVGPEAVLRSADMCSHGGILLSRPIVSYIATSCNIK